jgi:phenylpropionate dioxygenase-like ring-hydroxylating dioxygenase large terminal subunit
MLVTDVPAFRRFWYPIAFSEDLGRDPLARTVLGEEVVVWADGEGGAAAAYDVCPHRSSRLSIGLVVDGCIECPYHGWRFGGDGMATSIPQLGAGVPVPPRARLSSVHCTVRYGVVWVALDDPIGGLPEVPESEDPRYRTIRQFDEVWAAAAPRLVDNSFDPAHVSFVHRATFGSPDRPVTEPPDVVRTEEGLEMRTEVVVENHLDIAQRANRVDETSTVRTTVSRLVAPFLRVMSTTYPNGLHHILVTGITPVDDTHLQLVQWAIRNDTEADVATADVVAFDRAVTLEDQQLLEATSPDYEIELSDNVHIKVDRGTIAVRKVFQDIIAGAWPGLDAPGTPMRSVASAQDDAT